MPTVSLTNTKASQALRGQSVTVTLASPSSLAQLEIGQQCNGGSFSYLGYIQSIDTYGQTFKIVPAQPDQYFGNEGYLQESEIITVTL